MATPAPASLFVWVRLRVRVCSVASELAAHAPCSLPPPPPTAHREALNAPVAVAVALVPSPPHSQCRPSRLPGATRRVPHAAAAQAPARADSRPSDSGSQAPRRSARTATTQARLHCVRSADTRRRLICCCSSCLSSAWCVVLLPLASVAVTIAVAIAATPAPPTQHCSFPMLHYPTALLPHDPVAYFF
jgi:hypothetical protein